MESFYTFEHAGCTIELCTDEDPMSPDEWDTLGTVYALSRDAEYQGFESPNKTHGQAIEAMERRGVAGLVRYLRLCHGLYVLPIDVQDYGSSGIRVSVADEQDNDCSAYIATTDARVTALCGTNANYHTRELVEDALRGELKEWRSYFENEVVGYVVRCNDEIVDSCWSFYPDDDKQVPTPLSFESYRLAWEELPQYLRGYTYAVSQAIETAEDEQEERERAANQDVATA